MEINKSRELLVYRCWNPFSYRYQSFHDGSDFIMDFPNKEDLLETIKEKYGEDWNKLEIHEILITEKRVN